jgi:hypothetical protein
MVLERGLQSNQRTISFVPCAPVTPAIWKVVGSQRQLPLFSEFNTNHDQLQCVLCSITLNLFKMSHTHTKGEFKADYDISSTGRYRSERGFRADYRTILCSILSALAYRCASLDFAAKRHHETCCGSSLRKLCMLHGFF